MSSPVYVLIKQFYDFLPPFSFSIVSVLYGSTQKHLKAHNLSSSMPCHVLPHFLPSPSTGLNHLVLGYPIYLFPSNSLLNMLLLSIPLTWALCRMVPWKKWEVLGSNFITRTLVDLIYSVPPSNARTVTQLGHNYFLCSSYQFIIHQLSNHLTLYGLENGTVVK
jgi:hypothetical protein